MKKEELIARAGLDKTPEQIVEEHGLEHERAVMKRKNVIWSFLRWRKLVLQNEKYLGSPISITVSLLFWTTYVICISKILTGTLIGTITLQEAIAMFSVVAFVYTVIASYEVKCYQPNRIERFVLCAYFAGLVSAGVVGALEEIGLSPLGAVIPLDLFWMYLMHHSWTAFLRSSGRLCIFFPLMPLIRVADLWIAKHDNHPCLMDMPNVHKPPISIVQSTYLSGIVRVREELIGKASDLQKSLAQIEVRVSEVCTQIERVNQRLREAQSDKDELRTASLTNTLERTQARKKRLEEARQKLQHLIASVSAFLLECETKVKKLDGPLGDAELIRTIEAGEERDEEAIDEANRVTQVAVSRLSDQLMRLCATVEGALLPASPTDRDMVNYFQRLDTAAKRVLDIETTAEEKSESDDTDARRVH